MAKKYYSRSEKEKLAKKLAAVGRRMQRQRQILLRLMVWNVSRTGMCRRIFLLEKMPEV